MHRVKIGRKERRAQRKRLQESDNYMADETVTAERLRIESLTKQQRSELAVVCQGVGKSYHRNTVLVRIDLAMAR